MRYRDIILTANNNLRKSKVRTILTISAVFMGALTLMLTTGVGAGLKSYVDQQVNAVGAKDALMITVKTERGGPISNDNPKTYDPNKKQAQADFTKVATLSAQDIQKISEVKGIKSVQPSYSITPEYITTAGANKYLVTVGQAVEGLNQPLTTGRLVNVNGPDYEVTLPPAFVSTLGFGNAQNALGKTVSMGFKDISGQIFTLDAKVVGVQEKTLIMGNALNVNNSYAKAAYDKMTAGLPEYQKNQYSMAVAKFDTSMSNQQLQDLKQTLGNQGYSAKTLDDQLGVIRTVISAITTFLNIFAGIALVAATFGIVNTLFMAVQERTREIGLMKALGMGRAKIFALFSIEAILIGLWGALIALGAANILGRLGSHIASKTLLKDFDGLQLFSFPIKSMLLIIGLIMLIAFLAATLPARRAARLDPIEALRYE